MLTEQRKTPAVRASQVQAHCRAGGQFTTSRRTSSTSSRRTAEPEEEHKDKKKQSTGGKQSSLTSPAHSETQFTITDNALTFSSFTFHSSSTTQDLTFYFVFDFAFDTSTTTSHSGTSGAHSFGPHQRCYPKRIG
jgi:hypothetical protein